MTAYFFDSNYYNAAQNGFYPGTNFNYYNAAYGGYNFGYLGYVNLNYGINGQNAYGMTNVSYVVNGESNCDGRQNSSGDSPNSNVKAQMSTGETALTYNIDFLHNSYSNFNDSTQSSNPDLTYYSNGTQGNISEKRSWFEAGLTDDEDAISLPLPEELLKMFKPLECELCNVIVGSEMTAYAHYDGKTHSKNVNAYMRDHYSLYGSVKKPKVPFQRVTCEVCNVECGSLIQAQQHFNGKIHKKNLKKIQYIAPGSIISEIFQASIKASDEKDFLKNLPPPPPPPKLSDFICEICNVTANTEHQLIVHKNGARHKRKVKKLQEENNINGTDGISYVNDISNAQGFLDEEAEEASQNSSFTETYADSMPLANEPLQFEETSPQVGLCIKWYKDKEEVPPERLLEQEYQEIFMKDCSSPRIPPTPPSSPVELPQEAILPVQASGPPETVVIEYEAPSGTEIIPPFSIASVIMAMTDMSESINGNGTASSGSTVPAISLLTPEVFKYEIPKIGNESEAQNPSQNNESKETSEPSKPHTEEKKNPGKFITSNWHTSDSKSNSANGQTKKKPIVHFLTGFKKQLESRKKEGNGENEAQISEKSKSEKSQNISSVKKKQKNKNENKKDISEESQIKFSRDEGKFIGNSQKENDKSGNSQKKTEESKKSGTQSKDMISDKKGRKTDSLQQDKYDRSWNSNSSRKDDSSPNIQRKKYSRDGRDRDFSYSTYKNDPYRRKDNRERRYSDTEKEHRSSKSYYRKYKHHRRRHRDSSRSTDTSSSEDSDRNRHNKEYRHHKKSKEKEKCKESKNKSTIKQNSDKKEEVLTAKQLLSYLAPVSKPDPYDLTMYRTPSGLYYCVTCDFKSTSKTEFNSHLHCTDHIQRRKKAEQK